MAPIRSEVRPYSSDRAEGRPYDSDRVRGAYGGLLGGQRCVPIAPIGSEGWPYDSYRLRGASLWLL